MLELFARLMDAATAFCAAGGFINGSLGFILAALGCAYLLTLLFVPFSLICIAMNIGREKHGND